MKQDLIELIDKIEYIETLFHYGDTEESNYIPSDRYIYDVEDFIKWRESVGFELQDIYDRTRDVYVWNIINATGIIRQFDGRDFEEYTRFLELKGKLLNIRKNIDRYYPKEVDGENKRNGDDMKKAKLFISHSSNDIEQVQPLVDLLADMGLSQADMFCSSVPDYGVPLGRDIYDYLSSLFKNYNIHVIFMLSDNYYQSPACLNEMGAAWVLKNDYTTILLHGYSYDKIKGAVNPNQIGFRVDDDSDLLKKRLGELIEEISKKLDKVIAPNRWEKKRDNYIKCIKEISHGLDEERKNG